MVRSSGRGGSFVLEMARDIAHCKAAGFVFGESATGCFGTSNPKANYIDVGLGGSQTTSWCW